MRMMFRYPLRFLCWFRPHKERRIKQGYLAVSAISDGPFNRQCRRCGRFRLAKARARK